MRYADPPVEHWHLGVLTAKDKYVGLEQADTPIRAMVKQYVDKHAHPSPPVTVQVVNGHPTVAFTLLAATAAGVLAFA